MTASRAWLGVLLLAACSPGCSEHTTGSGLEPENPGNRARPENPTDDLAHIAPRESRCIVGPDWVEIDIAMPVTFVNGDHRWTVAYRWTLGCWPQPCEGTALYVLNSGGSSSIESFALMDARITSIRDLVGIVQWRDSVFVVDANHGRVTYTGTGRGTHPASGEAKCDYHGTPTPVLERKDTNEIRS